MLSAKGDIVIGIPVSAIVFYCNHIKPDSGMPSQKLRPGNIDLTKNYERRKITSLKILYIQIYSLQHLSETEHFSWHCFIWENQTMHFFAILFACLPASPTDAGYALKYSETAFFNRLLSLQIFPTSEGEGHQNTRAYNLKISSLLRTSILSLLLWLPALSFLDWSLGFFFYLCPPVYRVKVKMVLNTLSYNIDFIVYLYRLYSIFI